MALSKLVVEIEGNNAKLVSSLKDSEKHVDGFGSKLAGIGGSIAKLGASAALGLGGAAVAGLGASVKIAADFEQSLANVSAAAGVSGDALAAMRAEAMKIGADTSKSASEAVEAMGELAKAGMSVETVVGGAARSTVQLAEATGMAMPDAANLLAKSLNTFKAEGIDAAGAANLLAKAANASAIDVTDVGMSLSAVGPVAASAGLTMSDFAAAVGIMGNNALVGSDAGTSLKTMLVSMSAPTEGAKRLMEEYGLSMFDAEGNTRNFRDVLGDFSAAWAHMSDEGRATFAKDVFGTDAMRAANILLGEGVAGWDAFKASMEGAPSIAEQSATRLATASGALEMLKGTLETIAIEVGSTFLPMLTPLLKKIGEELPGAFDKVKTSVTTLKSAFSSGDFSGVTAGLGKMFGPEVQAAAEQIIGTVQQLATTVSNALGPAIAKATEFIGNHKEMLVGAAAAITGIVVVAFGAWAVSAAAAAAATIAAAAPLIALVAAGAGIALLVKNWDEIVERVPFLGTALEAVKGVASEVFGFLREQAQKVAEFFQENWPAIQQAAETVFNAIRAVIETFVGIAKALWETFGDELLAIVRGAWETIKTVISTAIDVILGVIKLITQVVNGDWKGAWDTAKSIVETILSGIKQVVEIQLETVWTVLRGVGQAALDALGDLGGVLLNAGKQLIDGLLSGIQSKFRDVQNKLAELTNLLPDWKGPEADDLVLLFEPGQHVIEGFIDGMESMFPTVEAILEAFTAGVRGQVEGALGLLGAGIGGNAPMGGFGNVVDFATAARRQTGLGATAGMGFTPTYGVTGGGLGTGPLVSDEEIRRMGHEGSRMWRNVGLDVPLSDDERIQQMGDEGSALINAFLANLRAVNVELPVFTEQVVFGRDAMGNLVTDTLPDIDAAIRATAGEFLTGRDAAGNLTGEFAQAAVAVEETRGVVVDFATASYGTTQNIRDFATGLLITEGVVVNFGNEAAGAVGVVVDFAAANQYATPAVAGLGDAAIGAAQALQQAAASAAQAGSEADKTIEWRNDLLSQMFNGGFQGVPTTKLDRSVIGLPTGGPLGQPGTFGVGAPPQGYSAGGGGYSPVSPPPTQVFVGYNQNQITQAMSRASLAQRLQADAMGFRG